MKTDQKRDPTSPILPVLFLFLILILILRIRTLKLFPILTFMYTFCFVCNVFMYTIETRMFWIILNLIISSFILIKMNSYQYKKKIHNLTEYALKNNVSNKDIHKIFKKCFHLLETRSSSKIMSTLKFVKFYSIISLAIIFCIFILYNHPKTHSILLRNLQNFIYPGLRIFRKIAVPIVTVNPSLTEWYDEWCLIENPYFQVNDMDCWPCSSVHSVQHLIGTNITTSFNAGIPFMRNEKAVKIDINKLFKLYIEYKDIFKSDANRQRSIEEFLQFTVKPFSEKNAHIRWRVNRMESSRKLRKLFPKLPGIPNWWNPSTEKYVFIDYPKSAGYKLPNTECANVVIQCMQGERLIQLNPSPECNKNCRIIHTLLKSHQSLSYNWWYYRPISLPSDNSTEITIVHLTSYC